MARDKDYNRLIHAAKWVNLRRMKLTSNPLCEDCLENGRITFASEVHHVKPVEDALTAADKEALMYDPHNLRSLCHACHVAAHVSLGRGGKKHARRRAEEKLRSFTEKFLGEEAHAEPRG